MEPRETHFRAVVGVSCCERRLPLDGARGALLTALAAGEAAGQAGGLFRAAAPAAVGVAPDVSTASDSITLRRRLVAIDFGQLTPPSAAAAAVPGGAAAQLTPPSAAAAAVPGGAAASPSGVLTLNLFDDASFTGFVESVAPTFSGGYSLAGRWRGSRWGR